MRHSLILQADSIYPTFSVGQVKFADHPRDHPKNSALHSLFAARIRRNPPRSRGHLIDTIGLGTSCRPRRGTSIRGSRARDSRRRADARPGAVVRRFLAAAAEPSDASSRSPLADRLLSFDSQTGVLRAEAGYSLQSLLQLFLPRGWFTPVSPGTQFVTLGGMVAADVHGKNHHCDGSIGRHVRAIRMRTASGEIVECSRDHEPDLFRATIGGMGLTGHILEVELQLAAIPSPWILERAAADRRHRRVPVGAQGPGGALAVHDGMDRLHLARAPHGTRLPAVRPMGHRRRSAAHAAARRCRA